MWVLAILSFIVGRGARFSICIPLQKSVTLLALFFQILSVSGFWFFVLFWPFYEKRLKIQHIARE